MQTLLGWSDPFIVEALALRDGAIFAQLRGFSHGVMETDRLEVIHLWTSGHNSRTVVAPIFHEIREISLVFASFAVQHVSREANIPADMCAKLATSVSSSECWIEDSPGFLISNLVADCNQISVKQ